MFQGFLAVLALSCHVCYSEGKTQGGLLDVKTVSVMSLSQIVEMLEDLKDKMRRGKSKSEDPDIFDFDYDYVDGMFRTLVKQGKDSGESDDDNTVKTNFVSNAELLRNYQRAIKQLHNSAVYIRKSGDKLDGLNKFFGDIIGDQKFHDSSVNNLDRDVDGPVRKDKGVIRNDVNNRLWENHDQRDFKGKGNRDENQSNRREPKKINRFAVKKSQEKSSPSYNFRPRKDPPRNSRNERPPRPRENFGYRDQRDQYRPRNSYKNIARNYGYARTPPPMNGKKYVYDDDDKK